MRKGNVHMIDILGIVQEIVVCHNKDNKIYKKICFNRIIFSSLGTENICVSLPIAAYLCSPIA